MLWRGGLPGYWSLATWGLRLWGYEVSALDVVWEYFEVFQGFLKRLLKRSWTGRTVRQLLQALSRDHQEESMSLFSYVSIEERIPAKHPLRQIRLLAHQTLKRLDRTFAQLYASSGPPSIHQAVVAGAVAPSHLRLALRAATVRAGSTPTN